MSIWTIGTNRSLPQGLADFLIEMFRSRAADRPEWADEPLPDDSRRQFMAQVADRLANADGQKHSARRLF